MLFVIKTLSDENIFIGGEHEFTSTVWENLFSSGLHSIECWSGGEFRQAWNVNLRSYGATKELLRDMRGSTAQQNSEKCFKN